MRVKQGSSVVAIKAVMTPFPWFIHIGDRLARAREVMAEHGIRHLPVTEDRELVGVLSDRDIAIALGACDPARHEQLSVGDACVRDAYVVELDEPLDRVLQTMTERQIGSTIVVRKGKLAGIFTVTDACRAFGEFLSSGSPRGGGEAA